MSTATDRRDATAYPPHDVDAAGALAWLEQMARDFALARWRAFEAAHHDDEGGPVVILFGAEASRAGPAVSRRPLLKEFAPARLDVR